MINFLDNPFYPAMEQTTKTTRIRNGNRIQRLGIDKENRLAKFPLRLLLSEGHRLVFVNYCFDSRAFPPTTRAEFLL